MGMSDWVAIAKRIAKDHDTMDGFVVLHGTDTMAYTASALSFLLEGLQKTVVITGSQIPLSMSRNDAVDNLMGAVTIAGQFVIPEVCLYFHKHLYRGNRCRKVNATGFDAFRSGNCPVLGRVGIDIEIMWDLVHPPTRPTLNVHTKLCPHVAAVRLFPGITGRILANFLEAPLKGLVIESYGTGNAPTDRPELMAPLVEASQRGVVVVNTTQCHVGTVTNAYATGRGLAAAGVVGCGDMTPESALAKLAFLLGQGLDPAEVRRLMPLSLRGEVTVKRASRRFHWQG